MFVSALGIVHASSVQGKCFRYLCKLITSCIAKCFIVYASSLQVSISFFFSASYKCFKYSLSIFIDNCAGVLCRQKPVATVK